MTICSIDSSRAYASHLRTSPPAVASQYAKALQEAISALEKRDDKKCMTALEKLARREKTFGPLDQDREEFVGQRNEVFGKLSGLSHPAQETLAVLSHDVRFRAALSRDASAELDRLAATLAFRETYRVRLDCFANALVQGRHAYDYQPGAAIKPQDHLRVLDMLNRYPNVTPEDRQQGVSELIARLKAANVYDDFIAGIFSSVWHSDEQSVIDSFVSAVKADLGVPLSELVGQLTDPKSSLLAIGETIKTLKPLLAFPRHEAAKLLTEYVWSALQRLDDNDREQPFAVLDKLGTADAQIIKLIELLQECCALELKLDEPFSELGKPVDQPYLDLDRHGEMTPAISPVDAATPHQTGQPSATDASQEPDVTPRDFSPPKSPWFGSAVSQLTARIETSAREVGMIAYTDRLLIKKDVFGRAHVHCRNNRLTRPLDNLAFYDATVAAREAHPVSSTRAATSTDTSKVTWKSAPPDLFAWFRDKALIYMSSDVKHVNGKPHIIGRFHRDDPRIPDGFFQSMSRDIVARNVRFMIGKGQVRPISTDGIDQNSKAQFDLRHIAELSRVIVRELALGDFDTDYDERMFELVTAAHQTITNALRAALAHTVQIQRNGHTYGYQELTFADEPEIDFCLWRNGPGQPVRLRVGMSQRVLQALAAAQPPLSLTDGYVALVADYRITTQTGFDLQDLQFASHLIHEDGSIEPDHTPDLMRALRSAEAGIFAAQHVHREAQELARRLPVGNDQPIQALVSRTFRELYARPDGADQASPYVSALASRTAGATDLASLAGGAVRLAAIEHAETVLRTQTDTGIRKRLLLREWGRLQNVAEGIHGLPTTLRQDIRDAVNILLEEDGVSREDERKAFLDGVYGPDHPGTRQFGFTDARETNALFEQERDLW